VAVLNTNQTRRCAGTPGPGEGTTTVFPASGSRRARGFERTTTTVAQRKMTERKGPEKNKLKKQNTTSSEMDAPELLQLQIRIRRHLREIAVQVLLAQLLLA
jgi:hypothetical protein